MKKSLHQDNRGVAHVAVVGLVIVIVGIVGAGWIVYNKQQTIKKTSDSSVPAAAFKCEETDKDLCKFLGNWKENKYYSFTSKDTREGKTTTSTFQSEGENSRITTEGEAAYEIITIGKTTYTKDFKDGKWWKQTQKPAEKTDAIADAKVDFEEPKKDEKPEAKTTYKKIGTEDCGKLTCFKYQVIEPKAQDETQFIWFDTKDYQLRRQLTQSPDGTSDQTFNYDKVSIKAPSPVKELGANQVVIPGSSEPMTLPSEAETQRAIDEIQNQSAE